MAIGPLARARLPTPRLLLLAPDPNPARGQAPAIAEYLGRNSAHFAPWDPPRAPDEDTPEAVARAYLYIDGAWRDHRLFAITNPAFMAATG